MKKEVKKISIETLVGFINREKTRRTNTAKDQDDLLYTEPSQEQFEIIYGVFVDDDMVGYLSMNRTNPSHCDKLYVSDSYRRDGVAAYAINQLGVLSVWVLEDNTGALKLYSSLGFQVTDRSGKMLVLARNHTLNQKGKEIKMSSYSEKFNSVLSGYRSNKAKKLSVGTEGLFDAFKKKEEEEKEKTIGGFASLFAQELDVLTKSIHDSTKDEWVIKSTLLGKVSNFAELIKSVKGQVHFLKDLEKAQDRVAESIRACNDYAKAWSADYTNEKLVNDGYDKLLGYKITYKNFPSLETYNKEKSAISLTDKFETFFIRMNYSDIEYTSKHFDGIAAVLDRFSSIPGIHADFKFSRSNVAELTLAKQEIISFVEELKSVNAMLAALYKDYLDVQTSKIHGAVLETVRLHKSLVAKNDEELMPLLGGLQELEDNYAYGEYTNFCQSVADAYVKYVHTLLNEQSKS